jgi:TatA/E family protein of Tat protein translocase
MSSLLLSLAFIEGLGGGEMILIFFVILLLFGGKRLPELARGFGKSVREFKKATAGVEDQIKRALDSDEPEVRPVRKKPVYTAPPSVIEPIVAIDTFETPAAPLVTPPPAADSTPPPEKPAA